MRQNPFFCSVEVVKQIAIAPHQPGVYRMLDASKNILYVGKAKCLRKRLQNYTHVSKLSQRLQRMVRLTHSLDIITTVTEVEALFLEADMIKKHQPPFNVLLKDAKSFAQILMTHHDFPKAIKFRENRIEAQRIKGKRFGPFVSTKTLNDVLEILYKVFRLRSCQDYDFSTRTRPCLKYHIQQCSAPCVGYISQKDYQHAVQEAIKFMQGKHQTVLKQLQKKMQEKIAMRAYEEAAQYRDKIQFLSTIQTHQHKPLN